ASDAEGWVQSYLAALEQAGLLRPVDQAPPIRQQPRVAGVLAVLTSGVTLGSAGRSVQSDGDLAAFFERIGEWYGDKLGTLAPIASYDFIKVMVDGVEEIIAVPVPALPEREDHDLGLAQTTWFNAFNVFAKGLNPASASANADLQQLELEALLGQAGSNLAQATITGPAGYGSADFLPADLPLPYTVEFQNPSTGSTVHEVRIVQQLDPAFSLYSFRLGDMRLGGVNINIPEGRATYQGDIDLRNSRGYVLRISAGVDPNTSIASWVLQAIDPETGEVLQDATRGLLTAEDGDGSGRGFVSYTINPRFGVATGQQVKASARVAFDGKAGFDTPELVQTFDGAAPVTTLTVRALAGNAYDLQWSAIEEPGGSGVRHVSVFVSVDGGAWQVWQRQSTARSGVFQGEAGHTYEFAALATDNAGNREIARNSLNLPDDGTRTNLGAVPEVGRTTVDTGTPPEPSNAASTNALFAEAEKGLPAGPADRPSQFSQVLAPFAGAVFGSGIAQSDAGIGPLALLERPDGSFVVSGGANRGSLYVLPADGGRVLNASQVLDEPIFDLAYDDRGGLWATSGGGQLLELDPTTLVVLNRYGDGLTQSLAFDAAQSRFYVSSGDGIELFDVATRRFSHFSDLRVDDLAIAPNGRLWASRWPARGEIVSFDAQGRPSAQLRIDAELDSLAFGQAGTQLAGLLFISARQRSGYAAPVSLYMVDLATLRVLQVATGGPSAEQLLATRDGRLLVANSAQVDVLAPLVAPRVLRTDPPDASLVALPTASVAITFNVDMKRGSPRADDSVLNPLNYRIVDSSGNALIITAVAYDLATRTATLSFESPPADVYTVTVDKRLRSAAGLALGTDHQFAFTAVQDFSALVDIAFVATRSDRSDNTVAFDVRVTNRTDYQLRVPVMLVLDPARYFAGRPLDASLTGGLWFLDIGNGLPGGVLAPGASTVVKTVTLTNPQAQHIQVGSGVFSVPYPNRVPQFSSTAPTAARVGEEYRYQAAATDPDGAVLSYVLMDGPAGLQLDGATGLLRWTPPANTAALAPVLLRAYDTRGGYATQAFTLQVEGGNRAPVLQLPPSVRLRVGQPFTLEVLASDPDGDRIGYAVDQLPPGARFDAERGLLSWTPAAGQAGTYDDVRVSVRDGVNVVQRNLTMIVDPGNIAPVLLGVPERTVRQGDPLRFTLQAVDDDSPTLRFSAPDLPPGAMLNPITGVFEWTPGFDRAGPIDIRFQVSDGQAIGERSVRVNVLNVNAAPVFEPVDGIQVSEGQPLTLRLFAFDPDNPGYQPQVRLADGTLSAPETTDATVRYSLANLPAGASFDPLTSLLSWTPDFGQAGSYTLQITATDDGDGTGTPLTTVYKVPLQVRNVNRAPVLPEIGNQSAARGQVLEVPIAVTDPDGNALTLELQNLPRFATFTDLGNGQGLLRIAPGERDRGNTVVTLVARDDGDGEGPGRSLTATRSFVISAVSPAEPPLLLPPGERVALIGQPLEILLQASDLDQDDLSFTATGLPDDATLTPGVVYGTAVLRWTPDAADVGSRSVQITVTDSGGRSDTQTLLLKVRASNAAPLLVPVGDRQVAEGATLQLQLAATDADGDAPRFSVANLPVGARFDAATGLLQWTPGFESAGRYAGIVLTASDGSRSSSETIAIEVVPTNRAPFLVPIDAIGGQERSLLQFTLTGSDPDGDLLVYRSLGGLPAGASFDEGTGQFRWTPDYDQAGVHVLQFATRDPAGAEAQRTVTITIDDVNRAPALSFGNHRVALGDTLRFSVVGSDPDLNETLRFAASGLPQGATLDAVTGEFVWTPAPGQVGEHLVVLSLSDGKTQVQRGLALAVDALPVGPQVTISLTPSFPSLPGQPVALTVLADAFSAIASRTLTLDGAPVALDAEGRAIIVAPATGLYTLQATATDVDGYSRTVTQLLRVRDPADTAAPVASLDATLTGRRLNADTAIRGRVADANLESWRLEIAALGTAADGPGWTLLAQGTQPLDGVLATLQADGFQRGFYQLRLLAQDVAGRRGEATTTLEIAAAPDAARFQQTVSDFQWTLGGHALDFVRRYDVLDAGTSGRFGHGWTLGFADLRVQVDVPPTGAEASGVYAPLQEGSRAYVKTPDGRTVGFTFQPQQVKGNGFGWFVPAWVPDEGAGWQLESAPVKLQRAAGRFYALDDGAPYHPASLQDEAAQYTLVAADGTRYDIAADRGLTSVRFADGVQWVVADSGIVGPGNEAIGFSRDAQGRLTRVTLPDGRSFSYAYDAAGNLVSARDLSTGSSQRYGYAEPDTHLLTLVSSAAGGQAIVHGPAGATTQPIRQDLGAALAYLERPVAGQLAAGATDLYSFAVRPSEVRLPQGGAFLLGAELTATDANALTPALPQIDGGVRIASGSSGGRAFAVYRFAADGLHTLRVAGSGAGAYTLRLFAVGDLNADQRVDGVDAGLLAGARGSQQGDLTFLPAADLTRDGRIDAADSQLLYANLGFAPNAAPVVGAVSGFTHVELDTALPVASFLSDPEGDALSFRIVGATHGVARLSGDGTQLLFSPEAGFFGNASVTVVADDGYTLSAPRELQVTVSNAPLLRIDFAERRPEIALGNAWRPQVIGDFADQTGVALTGNYVTLSTGDPAVTQMVGNSAVVGRRQGFDMLVAQRGEVRGATAVVVGNPNRFQETQLFAGLDVYPNALTLVPGASKPLRVQIVDGDLVGGPGGAAGYVAGNSQVLSVGADGLVTGLSAGPADVTVIYRGAEFVVPIRVVAPQDEQAVLGAEGGAIRARDGSVITIAPGALDSARSVSLTPVAESDVSLTLPPGWDFLAGYRLDTGGEKLAIAAQMAIPVPTSVPVGKELFLLRLGTIPDAQGNLSPIWWQDEVAIVGADHVARTSSPPYPGVSPAGIYFLVSPPELIKVERGKVTANFPLGAFPLSLTLGGVMASVAPFISITIDFGARISMVAIPQEGLPVISTVGVQIDPTRANRVDFDLARPASLVPQAPVIESASFEFRQLTPVASGVLSPVAVLRGRNISAPPGTAVSSTYKAVWTQSGRDVDANLVAPITSLGNGLEEVVVEIPQRIMVGGATLRFVRIDTSVDIDLSTGLVAQTRRTPFFSNTLRVPADGNYVVAGMFGQVNGTLWSQLGVFTQGDPAAPDPESALNLVARIPIGRDPATGAPYGNPKASALTSDHTRAYVTLSGQSSVAVVDMVALQQADADARTPELDQIVLPAGSKPFWISIDSANRYAYVSDEQSYASPTNPLDFKGRIYVIDIDPNSDKFHKLVETIEVDAAGVGLRQILVSDDNRRLYVAAPNRNGTAPLRDPIDGKYKPKLRDSSRLVVVNIDPADRPPPGPTAANPRGYRKQIYVTNSGEDKAPGEELWSLQSTGDPRRIVFTNRFSEVNALGLLTITNDDPLNFQASKSYIGQLRQGAPDPADPLTRTLTLGSGLDNFDVNSPISTLVLPADALKASIGPHPEYIFVGGFNRFIQGVPAFDPDAAGGAPPAGSNIGIVRGGELVAATTRIPLGAIDNLVFASGYNYLYASYRGVSVGDGGVGAMFAWNLVNLVGQIEYERASLPDWKERLSSSPVDRHYFSQILPNNENLQLLNTAINIRSDYRIVDVDPKFNFWTFAVPFKMNLEGRYVDANGTPLPWMRNNRGQWAERIERTVAGPGGAPQIVVSPGAPYLVFDPVLQRMVPGVPPGLVPSPFAPIGTGGTPRGLSAHVTETAPGPRVFNQEGLARLVGVTERRDLGLKDLLGQALGTQDCPTPDFNSTVELDTGGVVETHELAPYESLGRTQQLSLGYSSTSADTMPIVTFSFPIDATERANYMAFASADELSPSGDPLLVAQITFSGPGNATHTTPLKYWRIANGSTVATVGIQADLSALPAGYYQYTISATLFGKYREQKGVLLLDNRSDSPFGRGWSLDGLQQLHRGADGSLAIGDARGLMSSYDKVPDSLVAPLAVNLPFGVVALYKSRNPVPEGVEPELMQELSNGDFRRVARDGTVYLYSAPITTPAGAAVPGVLRKVTDRYSNTTEYTYDGAGYVTSVKDPVGLITKFEYAGNRIQKIFGPFGQVTTLSYTGKDLTRITDPDGRERSFGYDGRGRMTSEIDKFGRLQTDDYDLESGRATRALRFDGSEVHVRAWQVFALAPAADTASRDNPAFAKDVRLEDIRASYTAANGKTRTVTINERGQVMKEFELDASNQESLHEVLSRDEIGSVVAYTNEEGYTTYSIYDDRGNKVKYWDDASGLDPITGEQRATVITYDYRFNLISSITDERGNTTKYKLDAKGNVERRENADGSVWEYTYYPQGLMKTEKDGLGRVTTYEYDAQGRTSKIINPDQSFQAFTYEQDSDPSNPGGRIQTSVDEMHRVTKSYFDSMNRLIRVVQPEVDYRGARVNPVIRYTYDANGLQHSVTDAEGHKAITEFDEQGRLRKQIDHYGNFTEYHYNAKGELDWKKDALQNKTEYTYDDGRLETETDAAGGKTHYEYDFVASNGVTYHGKKPTRITTDYQGPHEATTFYEHDARGRLVLRTNPDTTTYRWTYDNSDNLISTVDERGTETRYEYDSMNRRTLVIQDFGPGRGNYTTRTYYDALGNVIAITDARASTRLSDEALQQWLASQPNPPPFTTVFSYDPLTNRKASMTDALGNTTTYAYDAVGNLLRVTAPGNRVSVFTYDELNRTTSVTLPDPEGNNGGPQSITRTEYDRAGNVLRQIDALQRVTEFEYDALNRLTATINAKLERNETHYDVVGNVEFTLDARGRETSYKYDKLNRQIEVLAPHPDQAGLQVTILKRQYDTAGNLKWEEDALQNRTEFIEYDALNRLRKTKDARGAITAYDYDELGNRTVVTDALLRSTVTEYDRLNRVIKITGSAPGAIALAPGETVPAGQDPQHPAPVVEYAYDEVGNLIRSTDARQGVTLYGYDAMNRRTSVTEADPDGPAVALQSPITRDFYDEVGNLVRRVDARGQETIYDYDKQGRLIRETRPDRDGAGGPLLPPSTQYFYDEVGNLVKTIDANGRESRVDYDELNRAVASWTQDIDKPALIHYDDLGRIEWREDEEGRRTTYGYDRLDRRTTVTYPDPDGGGPLAAPKEFFAYDLQGNLLSWTDARNNTETYGYDKLNRRDRIVDASGRATVQIFDDAGDVVREQVLAKGATVATVERVYERDALRRVVKTSISYVDKPGGTIRRDVSFDRYDAAGNRVRHIDELGRLTIFGYDALNRATTVTTPDPDGAGPQLAATTYRSYDAMDNLVSETDARGATTAYEYDLLNRLIRVVKPKASNQPGEPVPVTSFAYDAEGNRTAVTDEEGNTTRYEFDSRNQVKKITDARGGVTLMRYDRVGNMTARVDARGDETLMQYDALNRLVKTTAPDPDGPQGSQAAAVTLRSYDANGNLVRVDDPLKNPTQYVYDKLNRLVEIIDAKGNSSTRSYDGDGNLEEATDFNGNAVSYEYDGLGRQVAVIDALMNTSRLRFDAAGNVVWQQDAKGQETTLEYDGLNRLIKTTGPDPDGQGPLGPTIMQREYDANGNVIAQVDANKHRTEYLYDALNRLTRATDAEGQTVEMDYDRAGRVIARTVGGKQSADRQTTQFVYDELGRVRREIDALGHATVTAYDAVGHTVSVTDRRGFVTSREYDHAGRLVKLWEPAPIGSTDPNERPLTQFSYDAQGNLLTVTDARGNVTSYEYDELNRRTKVIDMLGRATHTRYDANGNVTLVEDARGNITRYSYDALNRQTGMVDARRQSQLIEYDALGNVQKTIDAKKRETLFGYDALSRLVKVTQPDPDPTDQIQAPEILYEYDAVGNRVAETDANQNTTRYTYDKVNRRIGTTDALTRTTSVVYDKFGNVAKTLDARQRATVFEYDALNRLTKVIQPNPDSTGVAAPPTLSYTYDDVGNLLTATDARNFTTVYTYDSRNQRIAVEDALKHTETTTYDRVGNVSSRTNARLQTTSYEYDALNRLIKTTLADPDGTGDLSAPVVRYGYDEVGNLITVTNARGFTTTYEYDELNRRDKSIDPDQYTRTVAFDEVGNLIASKDELNRVTTYAYDGLNRLIRQESPDPDGTGVQQTQLPSVTTFTYDAAGNLKTMTDARQVTTAYAYDALNRRIATTEDFGGALQRSTSVNFDDVGDISFSVDANNLRTEYKYDAQHRLVETKDALQQSSFNTYDLAGNLIKTVDASGRKTDYVYDAVGRRTKSVDDAGFESNWTYDEVGNLSSMTDRLQRSTSYSYDALDRLTKVTLPDPDGVAGQQSAPTLSYTYDDAGNRVSMTNERGFTTRYAYDKLDRLITTTDALEGDTTYEYDPVGNRVAVTDPLQRTTRFAYDNLKRLIAVAVPDPAGSQDIGKALVTTYDYDPVGNRVKTTDPLGHASTATFDALRRVVSETDATQKTTSYEYTVKGELKAIVDPGSNRTEYQYDELSRVVKQTDALGERSFGYDEVGRLTRTVDALGRVTEKHYDELGRNDTETWLSATGNLVRSIARSFDAEGQLRGVSDDDSRYAIDYDALGRMTRIDSTGSPGLPAVALAYRYDAAGNTILVNASINGVADWSTSYAYDELNRVTSIGQSGGQATTKGVEYDYDAAGQIKKLRRYDGSGAAADITTSFDYDSAGRIKSIVHADASNALASYGYVWDPASRLVGMTSSDGASSYSYDDRNQLTGADYSSQPGNPADQTFAWDANGNPLRAGVTLGSANRVLSDESSTYTYDAEGNRTRKTDKVTGAYTEYSWDHRNRLVAATEHDASGALTGSQSYRYDDFGLKVAASDDADGAGAQAAKTTFYVHDRDDVAMVIDSAGAVAELFLHGPGTDQVLAEQRGAELRWSLADHQGSVRDVANAAGEVIDHVVYDSFGRISSQTQADAAPRFGYTGRELDRGTGLMDYRARWYDPVLGRFASRDPIGFSAGDANLYRYVGNRPLDHADPSGLESTATGAAKTAIDFAEFLWDTTSEAAVSITTAASMTLVLVGGGLVDFGWGVKDAVVFGSKVAASAALSWAHAVTGDSYTGRLSNELYNETIGKIQDALYDPCAGKLETFLRVKEAITPGKGVTAQVQDWAERNVRANLSPRLQRAYDVAQPAAHFVSLFVNPFSKLSAASEAARVAAAVAQLERDGEAIRKGIALATAADRINSLRGEATLIAGKVNELTSAARGLSAASIAKRAESAARIMDKIADQGRLANSLQRGEAAANGASTLGRARPITELAGETGRLRDVLRIPSDDPAVVKEWEQLVASASAKARASGTSPTVELKKLADATGNLQYQTFATELTLGLGKSRAAAAQELWRARGAALDYTAVWNVIRNVGVDAYKETQALFKSFAKTGNEAHLLEHGARTARDFAAVRPPSLLQRVKDLVNMALHPVQTAEDLFNATVKTVKKISARLGGEVSPFLDTEQRALVEALDAQRGVERAAGVAVESYDYSARNVDRWLTRRVLDMASEWNLATKPEFAKAKTIFGLTAQGSWAQAGKNLLRDVVFGEQRFVDFARANLYRGDVDMSSITRVLSDGKRVPLTPAEVANVLADANRRLVARGQAAAFQHAAHQQMGFATGGYGDFGLVNNVGGSGSVTAFSSAADGTRTGRFLTEAQEARQFSSVLTPEARIARGSNAQRIQFGPGDVLDPDVVARGANLRVQQAIARDAEGYVDRVARQIEARGQAVFSGPGPTMDDVIAGYQADPDRSIIGAWQQIAAERRAAGQPIAPPGSQMEAYFQGAGRIENSNPNSLLSPDRRRAVEGALRRNDMIFDEPSNQTPLTWLQANAQNPGMTGIWDAWREIARRNVSRGLPAAPPNSLMELFIALDVGAPLRAAGPAAGGIGKLATDLADEWSTVIGLADQSLALWSEAMRTALPGEWRVSLADLPDGELGRAWITQLDAEGRPSEGRIVLDYNADGHGWFVDDTPLDAAEFADPSSAAAGRYDLFTVLAHEMGHVLGMLRGYAGYDRYVETAVDGSRVFRAPGVTVALADDGHHLSDAAHADKLMSDSLELFQRKLPTALEGAVIAAARATP
ncbi:MAG: tandem-95 repeat protein, partial [Burkholderiales bacterium]|nr:tandem-95 repeat protein [Burkholderiales bacterium]